MKMTFRGWKRETTSHNHSVTQVIHNTNAFTPTTGKTNLIWDDAETAYGKIQGVSLGGSFLVKFTFEPSELKSWLQQAAKANPQDTLRLIAEVQAEALIALATPVVQQE